LSSRRHGGHQKDDEAPECQPVASATQDAAQALKIALTGITGAVPRLMIIDVQFDEPIPDAPEDGAAPDLSTRRAQFRSGDISPHATMLYHTMLDVLSVLSGISIHRLAQLDV
jgi:hypothetical protein